MNLCSIFVSIIIGFVTLPENMTVINVVPAGTDINLIVLMLLTMLLTVFSSVQFAWYFWLQVPPRTNYKCAMKINNSIKLNCLIIILQLFSRLQPSDRLAQR